MARHKYSKEEIQEWYKEHPGALYFNRNDSNLFVPKRYTFGFSPNFAHPAAWIIVIVVIGLIAMLIFHKRIFG